MLEKSGKTAADFKAGSLLSNVLRQHGVRRTEEFERIYRLPKRDWTEILRDNYAAVLSEHLRRPGGSMVLRPAQAAVLTELHDYGGAMAALSVGEGKTVISALAPTIVAAQRPVLLIPAKLKKKTQRDFKILAQHWYMHPAIQVVSYEKLSRNPDYLTELAPDLLMADEAHRLKSLSAACTKRVKRYMRQNPHTKFLALSGTITSRSLKDFWHILMWALRPDVMPLPRTFQELEEWALAVDEKVDPLERVAPGALLELHQDENLDELERARRGVRARLQQTAAYVATRESMLGASLQIELVRPPTSKVIDTALDELRLEWTTPNGDVATTPVDMWRHARELACGFWYRWDPPAPLPWLEARRSWNKYVRHILSGSDQLDSPLQVMQAVAKGRFDGKLFSIQEGKDGAGNSLMVQYEPKALLERWQAVRPSFEPHNVPDWIDEGRMRWVVDHYLKGEEPCIVWVEHIAVGQKLAALSGCSFHHEQGLDAQGVMIEDHEGKSVIASIASSGEGRNLQAWSRMFVTSCLPNGRIWEQLLGRLHRSGQLADTVEVSVMHGCREQYDGFLQALRDATYVHQVTEQPQKLLLADYVDQDILDFLQKTP